MGIVFLLIGLGIRDVAERTVAVETDTDTDVVEA
jgi:hypothetical protein